MKYHIIHSLEFLLCNNIIERIASLFEGWIIDILNYRYRSICIVQLVGADRALLLAPLFGFRTAALLLLVMMRYVSALRVLLLALVLLWRPVPHL